MNGTCARLADGNTTNARKQRIADRIFSSVLSSGTPLGFVALTYDKRRAWPGTCWFILFSLHHYRVMSMGTGTLQFIADSMRETFYCEAASHSLG